MSDHWEPFKSLFLRNSFSWASRKYSTYGHKRKHVTNGSSCGAVEPAIKYRPNAQRYVAQGVDELEFLASRVSSANSGSASNG